MNKWIGTVLTAALSATLYAAPAAGTNDDAIKARQAEMLKAIQKELGLSDQQTVKWGEIQDRYLKKHMQLQMDQTKEINDLLTDEQRKKFEEMQQRFRERLNQRMSGGK